MFFQMHLPAVIHNCIQWSEKRYRDQEAGRGSVFKYGKADPLFGGFKETYLVCVEGEYSWI